MQGAPPINLFEHEGVEYVRLDELVARILWLENRYLSLEVPPKVGNIVSRVAMRRLWPSVRGGLAADVRNTWFDVLGGNDES